MDFKAALEIQRQCVHPLTLLDDHSRYLLAVTSCPNTQHPTAWAVLWAVMDHVGMPEAILADNYFGNRGLEYWQTYVYNSLRPHEAL